MRFLEKLERHLGWLAIPNLSVALIVGQVAVWLMLATEAIPPDALPLVAERVLHGEIWRPFTFIFMPPPVSPIWIIFAWYLFYLMGGALESYWGDFRYTIFILTGLAATVAVSFIFPSLPASNEIVLSTVFLAFATFNPNFELLIMFILPVKVKWLALLTWITYLLMLSYGTWPMRCYVLAGLANYFLFFHEDIVRRVRNAPRSMAWDARRFAERGQTLHRCVVCGATERTHPHTQFLYCSKCEGSPCYCEEHIDAHEHVKAQS